MYLYAFIRRGGVIKLFDNWFETVLQRSSPGRHGDSMPIHFSGNEDLIERSEDAWKNYKERFLDYIFTRAILLANFVKISSLENYCLYGTQHKE